MAYRVNLSWESLDPSALIAAGFDKWDIESQTTGVWSRAVPIQASPNIVEEHNKYVMHATMTTLAATGTPVLQSFRAVPYKSSDGTAGTPVACTASLSGYATIAEVRAQGYLDTVYSNGVVQTAIEKVSKEIDGICRQWFEPRFRRIKVKGSDLRFDLEVPIIDIMEAVTSYGNDQELEFVANRHLTHGIVNPDDRCDPHVLVPSLRRYANSRTDLIGLEGLEMSGVFGYTDLGNDWAGETEEGNRIPLSFGSTPDDIKRAALRMTLNALLPLSEQDEVFFRNRLTGESTRDQSYSLSGPVGADGAYGMTGDLIVDAILMRYMAPVSLGVV